MTKTVTFLDGPCARCHTSHPGTYDLIEFQYPIDDCDAVWTHWFPCPVNGDPVLVRFVKLDELAKAKILVYEKGDSRKSGRDDRNR